MGHALENLIGAVGNPKTLLTGYRALDALSPAVLASFWELTEAATALVERARAEELPAGAEPGAAQAKNCDELLEFALNVFRYTLELAATSRQQLESELLGSAMEARLQDVLMRAHSPETLHLLRRALEYSGRLLHSLWGSSDCSDTRHPLFVMDVNMLLNAIERLSACVPGVPNFYHAMSALPYSSRQRAGDRDFMFLLRAIAGEAHTWSPQSSFSEFKMLREIPAGTETPWKSDDPGRDPKDTTEYLRSVWSGANENDVTELDRRQAAAWSDKQLNPSLKIPRNIDPAILQDDEASEIWFFVNGVVTDPWIAQLNAEHLAEVFQRPINILHNPTDGLDRDLRECVRGRTFGETSKVSRRIFHELLKHVARKKSKGKIMVIAHSQGTIIMTDVVKRLRDKHPDLVKRMELFNFAFCADEAPDDVRHVEHYANENDFVSSLSIVPGKPPRSPYNVPGTIYCRDKAWGHFLGAHYLEAFRRGKYHDRNGNNQSVLFRYRDGRNYGRVL